MLLLLAIDEVLLVFMLFCLCYCRDSCYRYHFYCHSSYYYCKYYYYFYYDFYPYYCYNTTSQPANILVSCLDCSVKIADFGLSRVVEPTVSERKTKFPSDDNDEDEEESDDIDLAKALAMGQEDANAQRITSTLPSHAFNNKQSLSDHQISSTHHTPVDITTLHIIPGSTQGSPTSGVPTVTKVLLKRALTRHVVSGNTFILNEYLCI